MKLCTAQVKNYKCVEDSEPFDIDQVTCLLGKNEAGKSALLQALEKLNPVEGRSLVFEETEFPRRRVSTSRERGEQQDAEVVCTTWCLDDGELAFLTDKFGINPLASNRVACRKGYSNQISWEFEGNEGQLLQQLLEQAKLDAASRKQIGEPETIAQLSRRLTELDEPNDKLVSLRATLKEQYPDGSLCAEVSKTLSRFLPRMLYFADYHKLPGRISTNQLLELKTDGGLEFDHKVFLALLDLANTTLEDVNEIGESERFIMELEAVSNRISDEIFEYWSQNQHLEVEVRCDMSRPEDPPPYDKGWIFNIRIENQRHRATINFDDRSTGFIWFFSFLVWFSQVKKMYGDNILVLLDEPGLSLHGTAQKDLLRYFNERLKPEHQVIYTTHSPFMLDAEHIFSVRTVEDVVSQRDGREMVAGTKVDQKLLSRDKDTLLPLQGIAGFDLAQSMFVGPYVLVVEGPTEAAYINWFKRELDRRNRTSLDVRWAVCPAESASKVSSFVSLFAGRGLEIVALMDYHEGEKKNVDKLEDSGLLPNSNLIRTTELVEQDEADIEDVVGRELMRELYVGCLGLGEADEPPKAKPEEAPARVIQELDEHARGLPPRYPEFSHYAPAEFLLSRDTDSVGSLPGLETALDKFEALFERVNRTNDR